VKVLRACAILYNYVLNKDKVPLYDEGDEDINDGPVHMVYFPMDRIIIDRLHSSVPGQSVVREAIKRFIRLAFERLRILLFIKKRSSFEFTTLVSCPIAIIASPLSLKTMSYMEYQSKSCAMPLSAADGLQSKEDSVRSDPTDVST